MVDEKQMSAVLSEFARTLVTDFPIQGILDHLVLRIIEVLPISSAGVTLITPGAKPRYIAASDDAALRYEALQSKVGEGPCLLAYHSGEAVQVPDLAVEDRFPHFGPQALDAGMRAVFTFPLRQDGIRLGALDLYRDTPGGLEPDDLAAAQTLADVTAAYLTNAQARTDTRAAADSYRQSAMHDVLTGLPNRLLLTQRLKHAAQRGHRSRNPAAVLFVDLDRFKVVNDTHGHAVGDGLLLAVAERLTGLLRPGDTLARVAGDEFVILCEDLHQITDVELLATRIDTAFTRPFTVADLPINITASVGIAFAGPGEHVSDQLMHDADTAMYQTKRNGGAGHQIVDIREANRVTEWQTLQHDLGDALTNDQLQVHYQPVLRTSDGLITGVEALLRWNHPDHGVVSPLAMVAMAEQTGLIGKLGSWVLERACRDQQQWFPWSPPPNWQLAVNVSTTQLMAHGFAAAVADILDAAGIEPRCLVLEMTESVFIEDSNRAQTVLADLKELGVGVALDDFGTGYTSLSRLRQFPVDILKIDQSFLVQVGRDPVDTAIFSAVANLAHLLEFSVTAEGVETQDQRDEVAAAGCECAQGYFYAHPMPADEIAPLVASGKPARLPIPAVRSPVVSHRTTA